MLFDSFRVNWSCDLRHWTNRYVQVSHQAKAIRKRETNKRSMALVDCIPKIMSSGRKTDTFQYLQFASHFEKATAKIKQSHVEITIIGHCWWSWQLTVDSRQSTVDSWQLNGNVKRDCGLSSTSSAVCVSLLVSVWHLQCEMISLWCYQNQSVFLPRTLRWSLVWAVPW